MNELTPDDVRDAVGDYYDHAPSVPGSKMQQWYAFPLWHDEHLIDAFDWEGITRTLNEARRESA